MLQLDRLCLGEILFEIQDIADIRTTPAINGLVRIANDADIVMPICQKRGKSVLRTVRILIFIDEDIAETMLIFLTKFSIIFQKLNGKQKKIVKIQSIVLAQLLLVKTEKFRHLLLVEGVCLSRIGARSEHEILRIGNSILHL